MTVFNWLRHELGTFLPAFVALVLMVLLPAAPAHASMLVELCTADGDVRVVAIPLEKQNERDDQRDCASPCHAFLSRKLGKENGNRT
ncbi:hypothetical protein [Parasphingorhabdus halotolerans]|uniref:DUF2946 family protein n=1 Tax=Parasphingorhabdus halotolerans TaxID=2725558 RepID=A0A6H2DQM0_9SPHN|nr:hypothetical protein [Parasphingorhabdus halotolerans]QJB70498.1 hypothetical protein HF685_15550 [Parasphingorhabdus halotolerans]